MIQAVIRAFKRMRANHIRSDILEYPLLSKCEEAPGNE
jgi:hypothetical protein